MDFKVGDKVICKPGFTAEEHSGGSGYEDGRIFVVHHITNREARPILWISYTECGIYADACEYSTPTSHYGSLLKFNFIHK